MLSTVPPQRLAMLLGSRPILAARFGDKVDVMVFARDFADEFRLPSSEALLVQVIAQRLASGHYMRSMRSKSPLSIGDPRTHYPAPMILQERSSRPNTRVQP